MNREHSLKLIKDPEVSLGAKGLLAAIMANTRYSNGFTIAELLEFTIEKRAFISKCLSELKSKGVVISKHEHVNGMPRKRYFLFDSDAEKLKDEKITENTLLGFGELTEIMKQPSVWKSNAERTLKTHPNFKLAGKTFEQWIDTFFRDKKGSGVMEMTPIEARKNIYNYIKFELQRWKQVPKSNQKVPMKRQDLKVQFKS